MKILIINYRFHFSGGPERYMFNVINELEKRNHEVITFSVQNSRNEYSPYQSYFPRNIGNSDEYLYEKFKKNGLFYYDYLSREFYSFYIRRKLRRLIRDTQPDVCYLLPHKGGLSPSLIDELKRAHIPIVHRVSDYNVLCPQAGMYRDRHFCDLCKNDKTQVLKNRCIRQSKSLSLIRYLSSALHRKLGLYKKIDHWVTTNDFARTQWVAFGYPEDQITTIETFSPAFHPKKSLKLHDPLQFLYIGNIDDSKGVYDLIEAIKLIVEAKNFCTFQLNIYGGLREQERQKIQELIEKNQLQKQIVLHPPVAPDRIGEIYHHSDITIIPARWVENLPNVLIESIAYGIPVIVPQFGSFTAVVDDSVAFFFQPQNVMYLSLTLRKILLHPEQITQKSKNCINFAKQKFGTAKHIDSLLSLLQKYVRS